MSLHSAFREYAMRINMHHIESKFTKIYFTKQWNYKRDGVKYVRKKLPFNLYRQFHVERVAIITIYNTIQFDAVREIIYVYEMPCATVSRNDLRTQYTQSYIITRNHRSLHGNLFYLRRDIYFVTEYRK